MSPLGIVHTAVAVVALVAGAAVLARRKGTRAHRRLGWLYLASMLALNLSALAIYRLFGRFGPFHAAALASLATLVAGLVPARRRLPRERWLDRHAFFMAFSWIGLVAAAASEVATRVFHAFWTSVVAASAVVLVAGAIALARRMPATLAPFRRARQRQG